MAQKILVVDDNFEDLFTVRTILEKNNYKVSIATNASEALEILDANGFDLVLLNIKMPIISGYDAVKLIRGTKRHKNAKIVYISILPKAEVNLEGVNGFIQKPFSPNNLIAEIKKQIMPK